MLQSVSVMALSLALLQSPALAGPAEDAQALFDEFAADYPAINAVVLVEGETVWQAEGGYARDAQDGLERDYNIYSIAKMMTGLAYARLEADGLDLDQSVRAIDPGLPAAYDDVTLRHLLSHTGGVRHYQGSQDWITFADRRCDTPSDALGHFIDDPLIHAPGSGFQYTTYGFSLLSHLLVALTGMPDYDAAMRVALGEVYTARTDREGADKAANYLDPRAIGERAGAPIVVPGQSAECKFGGGGLLASAEDLAAFGSALTGGEIIETSRFGADIRPAELPDGQMIPYNYGMNLDVDAETGVHYAFHSGGSPGGRGFVLVGLEPGLVVATTSNFDGPNHSDLAIGLAQIFEAWPGAAD